MNLGYIEVVKDIANLFFLITIKCECSFFNGEQQGLSLLCKLV